MIESVYSNDNAEANQTNRVHIDYKMPKNIRQIGKSSSSKKIYVEDYVMTFTKRLPGEDYGSCHVAVLVGQYIKTSQGRCIFISGAVEVEGVDIAQEIAFTNDHWTVIYDNIKKYFVEAEIVGWFIGGPGYLLENMDRILKIHIDNFAGQDKTLLIFDNMEKEEAFYFYENGYLAKQEGYYIYYEKNEEMQNYMIEYKVKPSVEEHYDDRVSREIRTVLQNKKPSNNNKNTGHLIYAAGTLLAVIILVVGAAMLSNYDQMKNMQKTLDSLANELKQVESVFLRNENEYAISDSENRMITDNKETTVDYSVETEESLNVEVVPGGVSPLPEVNQSNSGSDIKKNNDKENDDNDDVKNSDKAKSPQDAETNSPEETKYYIVKAGDSLAGISYRLYKSANYISIIKRLNNIEDENMIYIGQKLILP